FIQNDDLWIPLVSVRTIVPIQVNEREFRNESGRILHKASKLDDVNPRFWIGEKMLPTLGPLTPERIGIHKWLNLTDHTCRRRGRGATLFPNRFQFIHEIPQCEKCPLGSDSVSDSCVQCSSLLITKLIDLVKDTAHTASDGR